MSNYIIYYNTRQRMFKDLAQHWKSWSEAVDLTDDQVNGMKLFFRHIGKRFGLIKTFKEIGVI